MIDIIKDFNKPKKCCRNCKFWTIACHYVYSDSTGCCEKGYYSNTFTRSTFYCGKFQYCLELKQDTPELKILKFERKDKDSDNSKDICD